MEALPLLIAALVEQWESSWERAKMLWLGAALLGYPTFCFAELCYIILTF